MRKLLFIFAAIMAVAAFAKGKPQPENVGFVYVDKFTDDATHLTYDSASIDVSLVPGMLKLSVLPAVGRPMSETLVDTLWGNHSYYQIGQNTTTDLFKERDVVYLYTLTPEHYLASYVVFSHFIDLKNEGLEQIVIRKFDAKSKRQWCININADKEQIKAFFDMLRNARKALKFDKLTTVEGDPAASGLQQRGAHEGNKVRTGHTIGTDSPLKLGW